MTGSKGDDRKQGRGQEERGEDRKEEKRARIEMRGLYIMFTLCTKLLVVS